jgi:hypothetical protein
MIQGIRQFGPPPGAPGIEIIERPGINTLADPTYGTTAMFGVLKRGPMGVAVPISSKSEYDAIYGDPKDPVFHLYRSGGHQLPDAIDGFFSSGGSAAQLWLTRLDLDGSAKSASLVLKSRLGEDVLRIDAANEGRWGGYWNQIEPTPVVFATARTFTLVAPGVSANEFEGANVSFSTQLAGSIGSTYRIISNTASNPDSGEVVFTLSSQFDLVTDGISGPTALEGTASYDRYVPVSGTVSFALRRELTGTVSLNSYTIVGTGTVFLAELSVGSTIYESGEARVVTSITSNTTLTVDQPFSNVGDGRILETNNTTLIGSEVVDEESAFTTELAVGDMVFAVIGGDLQGRKVAQIISDSELILESGFTQSLSIGSILQIENLTVFGTLSAFDTELSVGQYIIDPNRKGDLIRVTGIISATEFTIDKQFSTSFSDAELTKQNQLGSVLLKPTSRLEGLSVEIVQGRQYPDTHFGMKVYFNGSLMMNISDASLDPNDPMGLFVENIVNDSNVIARKADKKFQKWITVTSLWVGAYTTSPNNDVRPCSGAGKILALIKNRIYTYADFDYEATAGNFVYPAPYKLARAAYRVQKTQAPVALQGTVSATSGSVVVTGVSTNFSQVFGPGDYFYEPTSGVVRRVLSIQSDTQLTVDSLMLDGIPASSQGYKLGYLEVDRSYDLAAITEVGSNFLVEYPIQLRGGYDGDTSTILPYYFTKFADVDFNHIENASFGRNVGLIKLATPGEWSLSVQKAFAQLAAAKAYEYRAEISPFINSSAVAEAYLNNELGRNDFISVAFPSYAWISNPLGVGERFVSMSGDILGGEARTAVINAGYHISYAGMKAIVARAIRLPFEALPPDEAILNMAGIQSIKTMGGNAVVWGVRAPSVSSIFQFLHVRRIQSHYVRFFRESQALLEMLFQPNQPLAGERLAMILDNFVSGEYRKGVYTKHLAKNQAVQVYVGLGNEGVSSVGDSKDRLIEMLNGKLVINMRYVPTGIIERISISIGPDILVEQWGDTILSQN